MAAKTKKTTDRFVPYELQDMGGERAIRILQDLLAQLSMVESDEDLTTFELNILRRCAVNPPSTVGVQDEVK